MTRQRKWSPQAHTLLAALLESARDGSHGYDLTKHTGLKSGTLYPLLMRMADQEVITARWQEPEQPGRPRRCVYRLTQHGRALARELTAARSRSRVPANVR